ncbi:MAG: hypothetical protein GX889_01950 [Clostridiales bacterium]|nr:hypothetical protein [Clostridiales bacterium]
MNRFNLKKGDMILCDLLGTGIDYAKGRIIEINHKEAKIEVGICNKKSEDIYRETFQVNIANLYPITHKFNKKISLFKTPNK